MESCKVLDIITKSTHLPVTLELDFDIFLPKLSNKEIKWKSDKLESYVWELYNSPEVGKIYNSVDQMALTLANSIHSIADKVGMIKCRNSKMRNHKPWYNEEFLDFKRFVKKKIELKNNKYQRDEIDKYNKLKNEYFRFLCNKKK